MISDGRSSLRSALKAVDQTSAFPSALKRVALGRGADWQEDTELFF